jgi:hypothetical protein
MVSSWSAPASPIVVQIRSADGEFRGSGFFVAPRIVATCAHVVERDDRLVVRWEGPDLVGRVLVREPESRDGRRYYPPPDIAFVGVETLDNPSAYLEASPLGRDVRTLFVEGFSAVNPSDEVGLERRTVPVLGESDQRYILLDDRHIVPGMSGSPIVEYEGSESVRGMLKSGRLAQGNSAYMIPAWQIRGLFRRRKSDLRAHMRDRPALVRPRPRTPLHTLLTAQREVAQRYPYRVAGLTRRDPPPLSSVYVEQRTRSSSTTETAVAISPIELFHRHRNALIVGGPGGGKSTLIQQLVAASAAWWLDDSQPTKRPPLGPVVAVRAAAQDLLGHGPWYESLARAVADDLGGRLDFTLEPEHFERPPVPGADWLVLVDGLDEVLDRGIRRELVDVLGFRVSRYGSTTRFVVASRPLDDREFARLRTSLTTSDRGRRLGEYDLRPFDREMVRRFAGNWFRPEQGEQSPVEPADFLEAITTAGLAPLVEVPLLATIAAIVFEEKPTLPLPLDRAGLYETFVMVLLTMRNRRRDVRAALREQLAPLGQRAEALGERMLDDRLDCLSHLAVRLLRHGERPRDSLPAWIEKTYGRTPVGVTRDHMRDLLVETGLVAAYGEDLVFIHQSFAEYLASLLLVGEFDPKAWLAQVRRNGPDSLGLFTLAAWGDAGNDTRPVVQALAEPGERKEYPHLREVAAVVQDGGVLVSGDPAEIIDLTETAVRETRDEAKPAVNEALRAILQRTRDTARVVQLVVDDRLPISKRAEAARVLVTSETAADHETGLTELIRLAYETRLSDRDRLEALSVIVESGPRHERRHAVQRLTQYVETAHDLAVRMRALDLLRQAEEMASAAAALLRRALDVRRPLHERREATILLWSYLDERGDTIEQRDAWEPFFEEPTYRAVTSSAEPDDYGVLAASDAIEFVGFGPGPATSALGSIARTRPIAWDTRTRLVSALSIPAGARADGPPVTSSLEPLSWQVATILAGDPQAPWRQRLALMLNYARRIPDREADIVALLTSWVHDSARSSGERKSVLRALLSLVDDDEALALAGDDDLPVRLRSMAALAYGVAARRPAETRTMLAAMARTPGAGPLERVGCLFWRALLPVLIRREEL